MNRFQTSDYILLWNIHYVTVLKKFVFSIVGVLYGNSGSVDARFATTIAAIIYCRPTLITEKFLSFTLEQGKRQGISSADQNSHVGSGCKRFLPLI